jgi:Pyridine nucleotide-disulphide oxidoreductase, dimerisation domain
VPDGGARLYAETVRRIHQRCNGTRVELLIPDFNGTHTQLDSVFDAEPEVLAHNVETVPRLFRRIRPAFTYRRSLEVITAARQRGLVTKRSVLYDLAGNGKSQILGTAGVVKLVEGPSGCVAGVHMVGERVSELVDEAQMLYGLGASVADAARLVHAHPTQGEAFGETLLALAESPLHVHR